MAHLEIMETQFVYLRLVRLFLATMQQFFTMFSGSRPWNEMTHRYNRTIS